MRVAAIYDIHGNLPALEAVLEQISRIGVDRIVIGGDVVPGPLPRETLARLGKIDVPTDFIHGNGEIAILTQVAGSEPAGVPEQFRPVFHWTANQLDAEDVRWLRTWPKTFRLEVSSLGSVLFCHATLRDENEIFTRLTPQDRVSQIFQGTDAAVVVCGHTHMQFDRNVAGIRIVNAGSVGMPFGQGGAHWLILDTDVAFQRTPYDLEKAAERIRGTAYPQAELFASTYILNPPSEEQMLNVFEKAQAAAVSRPPA
jgi:putative phosphoesterase